MATAGAKKYVCKLVKVEALNLGKDDLYPTGLLVSGDMLMVTDKNESKVWLYSHQEAKLLAASDKLEHEPSGICLINNMEVCVIFGNNIEIMSVQGAGDTGGITRVRTLHLKTQVTSWHRIVKCMDKVVVCGRNQDYMICWCIVSLTDGYVDTIHKISKGSWSNLTTKHNMIYISCTTDRDSPDTGVYGYDIQNPSKQTFIYKHEALNWPRGITVDTMGFIFVANYFPCCIHCLTEKCELVTIFREGMPSQRLSDIFWDQGLLYCKCEWESYIVRYKTQNIRFNKRTMWGQSVGSMATRKALGYSPRLPHVLKCTRDHKAPADPESNGRKQPASEDSSLQAEQGLEDREQSSEQIRENSAIDEQGLKIPVEILSMDQKSQQRYKEALRVGKVKVYNIRVMVVGHYGVGKTTLTKRLLEQQVDISERNSTEGIDIHKHCFKVSMDNRKWIVQHEDLEILEKLQPVLESLPDVIDNQEGHSEVIDQGETTHEELHGQFQYSDNDNATPASSESVIDQNVDIMSPEPPKPSPDKADQSHSACDADIDNQERGIPAARKGDAEMMNIFQSFNERVAGKPKKNIQNSNNLSQEVSNRVTDVECYFDTYGGRLYYDQYLIQDLEILEQLQPFLESLPGVIGKQEGHSEVIDHGETTLEELHGQFKYSDNDNDTPSSSESVIDQKVDSMSPQTPKLSPDKESHSACDEDVVDNQESGIQGDAEMMEIVQSFNERVAGKPKKNIEEATVGIWDFAGQDAFYTTHQTFLTWRAIYLLVTDLSEEVSCLVTDDTYFDTDRRRLHRVQDLVEGWLNSIHCCEPSSAAGIPLTKNDTGTLVTSPSAGTPVTDPPSGTQVTSPSAATPLTSPSTGTPVTSPSAATPLTSPSTGTPVKLPSVDTLVTSPSASKPVISLSAGTPLTSSSADTPATAPSNGTLMASPSAGTPVISASAGTLVTSPSPGTPVTSSSTGTSMTSHSTDTTVTPYSVSTTLIFSAAGTPVSSLTASITLTSPKPDTAITLPAPGTSLTSQDDVISATPPVILVGTHVDKIPKDKREEVANMYFQQIRSILKNKPTLHHLVDFIAIDNAQLDPQLKTLKNKIFQLASDQRYWGEEVPISYVLMEKKLRKLKDNGTKVISFSDVEKIDQASPVPIQTKKTQTTEAHNVELDLFLRFMHEIGTLIYFSVEGLREDIVLDPQWLIDAQKSLITAEMFIEKNYPNIKDKWNEFKQQGKLTDELIDAVWTKKNNPEFYDNKKLILKLLEQLNIIARPVSFTEEGQKVEEDYFLTPCMLRQESSEELVSSERDPRLVNTSVLCFVFTGKFLPPPIFHRLLAACVAKWQVSKKNKTSEYLISSGRCVFDLDLFHRLTLHCSNHIVSARITRMIIDDVKTPDKKLCIRVKMFITECLTKIISYLELNLPYDLHIQCPRFFVDSEDGMVSLSSFEMWLPDEGHDPNSPITREHINHARLRIALVTVCGNAMRDMLLTNVPAPHKNIYQAIMANQAKLTGGRGKCLLNPDQIQVVFPDPQDPKKGTVDKFDLSLLYTLIRNVSTVPAPVTGWGNDPQDHPRDISLGASVERIRLYRNRISGHSVDGQISQQYFEKYWNEFDAVLHDIETVTGKKVYRLELEKQRRQVISVFDAC